MREAFILGAGVVLWLIIPAAVTARLSSTDGRGREVVSADTQPISTASLQTRPSGVSAATAYKGWTVSSLEVRGVDKALAAGIRNGLLLSGKPKFLGRERASLYSETLLQDIERARLYLARRGYPYAEVEPSYKPDLKSRKVALTLTVATGPPMIVREISVSGAPPLLDEKAVAAALMPAGSVFREDLVGGASLSIESALRNSGYAKARVEPVVERIDSTNVRVRFQAEPGDLYEFGGVVVEGAPADLVPLVVKTINLKRGSTYSPAIVQEDEDYLRLLDLFGRVRLSTQDSSPGVLDLRADLTPRKSRTMELNVGYWTDELVKVGARWRHRNLFREGRGLDVKSSYSRFEHSAGISAGWPALFGSRTWGTAGADVVRHREDSYDLISAKLEMSGTYRPTLLTSIRAGVSVSDVSVDVKTDETAAFVEKGGLLTYFSLGWNRDSSDDRLYPTRGRITWMRVEWAPSGFLTEAHYFSLEGSGAAYMPLGHGFVAAARLTAGLARPLSDSEDLLPNKRFFSGGATSMRGFRRHKLGPLDSDGAPLGGETKLEASVEIRFPIIGRVGGAAFIDTGQVWPGGSPLAFDRIEVAAGPGLVIRTPIGPVRGDVAFRLTDFDVTQPYQVYHILVGHPF